MQGRFLKLENSQLQARRIDDLVMVLTTKVSAYYMDCHLRQTHGFMYNRELEKELQAVARSSHAIQDSDVTLPSGPGCATVKGETGTLYRVTNAGTAQASCVCIDCRRQGICQHIIKVTVDLLLILANKAKLYDCESNSSHKSPIQAAVCDTHVLFCERAFEQRTQLLPQMRLLNSNTMQSWPLQSATVYLHPDLRTAYMYTHIVSRVL